MVRKKANLTKRTNAFAPPGKIMMIERNKKSLTPFKTPVSSKSMSSSSPKKSVNFTVPESSKKTKVSQLQKALREIKRYQGSVGLLIPKAAFSRVVREITQNIIGKPDIRFTALSLMALQEATEMAIINLLEIANFCCAHAKRVTLTPADIRLTRRAFGISNSLNT